MFKGGWSNNAVRHGKYWIHEDINSMYVVKYIFTVHRCHYITNSIAIYTKNNGGFTHTEEETKETWNQNSVHRINADNIYILNWHKTFKCILSSYYNMKLTGNHYFKHTKYTPFYCAVYLTSDSVIELGRKLI